MKLVSEDKGQSRPHGQRKSASGVTVAIFAPLWFTTRVKAENPKDIKQPPKTK